MRVARLLSMVFEIEAHPGITAAKLADHLGVSVRTVYRDVSGLQMAGVPVYGTVGRHGGLRLVDGYRSQASALRVDEAAALLVGLVPGVAAQLGVGVDADRAVRKVRSSSGSAASSASAGSSGGGTLGSGQVLVDPVGWYRSVNEAPHLATVAAAMRNRMVMLIRYRRWAEPTEVRRRIAPLGLVCKAGTWYVMARSRNRIRTYRVNQILSVQVTTDTFEADDGFDLDAAWAAFMVSFRKRLHVIDVRVRLERSVRDQMRTEGDASTIAALDAMVGGEPDTDDEREITLPFESLERAAAELMRLGPGAVAVGPPELRELVMHLAVEIAELYSIHSG